MAWKKVEHNAPDGSPPPGAFRVKTQYLIFSPGVGEHKVRPYANLSSRTEQQNQTPPRFPFLLSTLDSGPWTSLYHGTPTPTLSATVSSVSLCAALSGMPSRAQSRSRCHSRLPGSSAVS